MSDDPVDLDQVLEQLMKKEPIEVYDDIETSQAHLPVIMLIDVSDSMRQEVDGQGNRRIDVVNDALQQFISDIVNETSEDFSRIKSVGDFCILAYGGESMDDVIEILPWTHGSQLNTVSIPKLETRGRTPMHQAIIKSGELMLDRLKGYYQNDVECHVGAIFNLTDGWPTDDEYQEKAKASVKFWEFAGSKGNSKAEFHHLGVPGYAEEALVELSKHEERVSELDAGDITKFFKYITITFSFLADGQNPTSEELARMMS